MKKANPEIENTARLMMTWLRSSFQSTRDMAATLALVNTALIWTQEQDDEAKVRELMAQTTEVIVTMWKTQREAASEVAAGGECQRSYSAS